jgi:hypothetical protein
MINLTSLIFQDVPAAFREQFNVLSDEEKSANQAAIFDDARIQRNFKNEINKLRKELSNAANSLIVVSLDGGI